ncbi:MAG: Crp/Fnr family transcriptional regulator [Bacteroidota bacterium]
MSQLLRQHIIDKLGHEPAGLEEVLSNFEPLEARSKQLLLSTGDICRHCYYLESGCLKLSTLDAIGNETTTNLIFDHEWCTSLKSFSQQIPSDEQIVCVEPSQLWVISYERFRGLAERFPPFEQMYRQLLEESYTQSLDRINSLMGLDATGRVKWLLEQQPLIFSRLSNRLIASYLGLSEATLSRLKSKL